MQREKVIPLNIQPSDAGWKTLRAAMKSWGNTLRLGLLILVFGCAIAVPIVLVRLVSS
jgi:hypothetical protein